ncbi:MAG: Guanylate kinase [uncultured Chloroflexi bacterium]|uniref:Guanylate kinase n=1 Tax=uncultured Chloroflexota bacterium TaxID=166587 RepID=A0A6J4HSQ1_9CHLR|nr:MAG: Guanylate kinase [uncultured Chloroflexota bacterium]
MVAVPERALQELRAKAGGGYQPRLFILSAPSGTGKDAVLARLRERMPDVRVVVTCTTRSRRPEEVDGVHYQFVSEADFLAMRSRGDLLEDVQYAGHYYGVPAGPVRDAIARGQDVILKIEVRGGSIVKLQVPGTILVFLAPPSVEELQRRLEQAQRERGVSSTADFDNRLAQAQRELACIPGYDYLIVNHPGRLDDAVAQFETIILAERLRVNATPVRV